MFGQTGRTFSKRIEEHLQNKNLKRRSNNGRLLLNNNHNYADFKLKNLQIRKEGGYMGAGEE